MLKFNLNTSQQSLWDRLTARMKDVPDQHALEIEKADENSRTEEIPPDDESVEITQRSLLAQMILMSVR